jgi:hypothetical protein
MRPASPARPHSACAPIESCGSRHSSSVGKRKGPSASRSHNARVPDAAQRERYTAGPKFPTRVCAKRCAADPGPPQAWSWVAPELCGVPGLQRIMSSAVIDTRIKHSVPCAAHAALRPGHGPGAHGVPCFNPGNVPIQRSCRSYCCGRSLRSCARTMSTSRSCFACVSSAIASSASASIVA